MSFEDEYKEYAKNIQGIDKSESVTSKVGKQEVSRSRKTDKGIAEKKTALNNIDQLITEFESSRKPTKEETHKRTSFLLCNDLNDQLNKIVRSRGRGTKNRLLNSAVKKMLESFETET